MTSTNKLPLMFAVSYQYGLSPYWYPTILALSRTAAIDAALRMYDEARSYNDLGWRTEWPRKKKLAFLRRRGMRLKKFAVALHE